MNELKEIENIIQLFFQKTGFQIHNHELGIKKDTITLRIESNEPHSLIGKKGRTLNEIQYLLSIILKKRGINYFFDLDINNYKKKKVEYLKELARKTAEKVLLTKKEESLEPMPAYERKIIHLELSQYNNIETKSIGEGNNRKVTVRIKKFNII